MIVRLAVETWDLYRITVPERGSDNRQFGLCFTEQQDERMSVSVQTQEFDPMFMKNVLYVKVNSFFM